MGDELKPCPCGAEANKPAEIWDGTSDMWVISCVRAECLWSIEADTEAEAITAWNTRTETQSQATIDELVGALNDAADDFSAIKEAVEADDGRLCWRTANFALDHIDTILSRHEGDGE